MTISSDTIQSIEAILFDVNGTLRVREPHAHTQGAAIQRMLEILGKRSAPDSCWDELALRQKAYSTWAQDNLFQLSEGPRVDEQDQALRPDAVIHSLTDLLDIFPMRNS